MENIKKKHHVIPKMHLKHFVDQKNNMTWVYDKREDEPYSSHHSNIAHQRYFYAVRDSDGNIDNRIEDWLATIECKASPIYHDILNERFIPQKLSQERHDFSTFLALLFCRTEAMRRISAEIDAKILQNELYNQAKNDFSGMISGIDAFHNTSYTEQEKQSLFSGIINPEKFEIHIPAERTLSVIATSDKLTPIFENMYWTLLYPKNGFFVTSDNPIFKSSDPKTFSPIYGDGAFTNRTIEVSFPLSPKLALCMTHKKPDNNFLEIDRMQVDMFNNARAHTAERFIYSHIKHKNISKMVCAHRKSRMEFKLNCGDDGPENYSKVVVKPPARKSAN